MVALSLSLTSTLTPHPPHPIQATASRHMRAADSAHTVMATPLAAADAVAAATAAAAAGAAAAPPPTPAAVAAGAARRANAARKAEGSDVLLEMRRLAS